MKNILIIILSFFSLIIYSQSNIVGKNITAKDTAKSNYLKLVTHTSLPNASNGTLANRNDSVFLRTNGTWQPLNGITAGYGIISDSNVRVDSSKIETRYHSSQTFETKLKKGVYKNHGHGLVSLTGGNFFDEVVSDDTISAIDTTGWPVGSILTFSGIFGFTVSPATIEYDPYKVIQTSQSKIFSNKKPASFVLVKTRYGEPRWSYISGYEWDYVADSSGIKTFMRNLGDVKSGYGIKLTGDSTDILVGGNDLTIGWDSSKYALPKLDTFVTGANAKGRVAIWDGAKSITGSPFLVADTVNKKLTITKNALGATYTGGLELVNTTPATVGIPSQNSPPLVFRANSYDPTNLNSGKHEWKMIADGFNQLGYDYSSFNIGYVKDGGVFNPMLRLNNAGDAAIYRPLSLLSGLYVSTLNANTPNAGLSLQCTSPATSSTRVRYSNYLLFAGTQYNASSLSETHVYWQFLRGTSNTSNSELVQQFSYNAGTNYKDVFGIRATYGDATANNLWFNSSGSSPNLSVTSSGKSIAIGANASNSHIIADNTGNLIFGFDSKTNIDNRVATPATVGTIINNDGYMYRRSIAADSMYRVKKEIDQAIQFAVSGKNDSVGQYDASSNLWPSTGIGGGSIKVGDWWSISVGGTLGGVTVTTDNQIYALTSNPGQSAANWDIVGSTTTIPIARIAGNKGKGYVIYNGNAKLKGSFYYDALSIPSTYDSILMFDGFFWGSKIMGRNATGTGVYAVTESSSYPALEVNKTAGTGNLAVFNLGGVTKSSFDYTGKLTANGGVDVGTSMAQGRYIRANYTDADNGVLGNISATLQLNNSTNGIGKSTNALNYIADKQHRIILRQNPAYTRTDTLLSLYTSYYTNQLKIYVDTFGYIHNNPPHYKGYFADSSVVISLTQNTWYQITNQTYKTTWPTTDLHGFTDSGDTAICSTGSAGHYLFTWEINISGSDSKTFEYRILRKRSGTTTEQWRFKVTGTGTDVLRHVQSYVEVQAGDRVWVEIRSTSSDPGNVTILGGQWYAHPIHL